MAMYFTEDTDKAITEFLESSDRKLRNRIFNKRIEPTFRKLIESIINTYGFYKSGDMSDLAVECMSYLFEMMPKFDPKKGTKAFSYFTVITKNWFIFKINETKKRGKFESDLNEEKDSDDSSEDGYDPYEEAVDNRERWKAFYGGMESRRDELTNENEKKVLDSVIFIMKNPDLVPIFSRKAVLLYLRDMTDLDTKKVSMALRGIQSLYGDWKKEFFD